MGAAGCSKCLGGDEEAKFSVGGAKDLSEGPVTSRRCTDVLCIPIFVIAQLVFIGVTVAGFQDGNPKKLYRPRDFQGAYCGMASNWNNGPDLSGAPKVSYTMNVSSMLDEVVKQTLCSTATAEVMMSILPDQDAKDAYDCDCCRSPCGKCEGAFDVGGDLRDMDSLSKTIADRMAEFTDPGKARDLFSPSGSNGDSFSTKSFWTSVTEHFNLVCLPECQVSGGNGTDARSYTYVPAQDTSFYRHWKTLLDAPDGDPNAAKIKAVMVNDFTFSALPASVCPYDASMCVPVPGLKLEEFLNSSDYCTFGVTADVVDALGHGVAVAFETLGIETLKGEVSESFGKWMGDFQASFDTFVVASVLSFVIGLMFLVLLRFFIGFCVWFAVFCTVVMFFAGGMFLFVLSGQCEGAGLLESGRQTAYAMAVMGQTTVSDLVGWGGSASTSSEEVVGDGSSYRGRQQYTKSGLKCLDWDTQTVFPKYTSANYQALQPANETENYCRNPYNTTGYDKPKTIWCITSDPDVPWEECAPIGVIQPECIHGYAIAGQNMRDALRYSSFIVWALGFVWILVVCCFVSRIRFAIALNKVAAVYVAGNPATLLIPVAQAVLAILWCGLWFYSASFLLSQVPDSGTPKGAFLTYAEAYGTESSCGMFEEGDHCESKPGACTSTWPAGGVWKDQECEPGPDGPMCWRCWQPRFSLDWRFAVSFFVFLWNNAFNVALGQMLIAMAVGLWFFSREKARTFVVGRAVKTVLRHHLGTVAFGSFILALVEFIRYVMQYFEKQAQQQKNRVVVMCLRVMQCCIWCLEKCIKFLNKNAYIQTALMGTGFCVSAKAAFNLILRNFLRFGTMAALGNAIRLIGFLCITSGSGVVAYLLMREMHPDISPFMPTLLCLMVAYVVAKLFMNVFGLAVDTCLQCFLAIEEMEVGGEYVPACLKKFLGAYVDRKPDEHGASGGPAPTPGRPAPDSL